MSMVPPHWEAEPVLPDLSERRTVIIETLRFLTGWVEESEHDFMLNAAAEIERSRPEEWMVCPLCQETLCDDNCPVRGERR